MKKTSSLFLLIIAVCTLCACRDDNRTFRLKGEIDRMADTVLTLYSAFSIPDTVVQIPVKEGRFECVLPMDTLTPMLLHIPGLEKEAVLFADKGVTLKVKGDTVALARLRISGSTIQEEYEAFADSLRHLTDREAQLLEVDSFIIAHPQSEVSIYLIDKYYVRTPGAKKEEVNRIIGRLSGIMHDHPYIARLQGERKENVREVRYDRVIPLGTLPDSTGTFLNTDDYKGKLVVLSLWASWHDESRALQNSLKPLVKRFAKRPVEFVSLSLDSDRSRWLEAVRTDTLADTHVCNFEGWNSSFLNSLGTSALPALYVLNESRRVMSSQLWGEKLETYLDKQLTDLEKREKEKKKKASAQKKR